MKTFTLLKSLLIACLFSLMGGSAWAQEFVTDVITADDLEATSTIYTPFSNVSKTSNTIYAGQTARSSDGAIQLNSKLPTNKKYNGIVVTSSVGIIKSITITFKSNTSNGRVIDVYGKNTSYASADDLYGTLKADVGDKLGSASKSSSALEIPIKVSGSYKYIGIRPSSGAIYLESISITWQKPAGKLSITSAGYATYFTDKAFTMPNGVTGSIITDVNNGSLRIEDNYLAGSAVPANTALLLKGAQGDYEYYSTTTTETAPKNNMLHGSTVDAETMVDGDLAAYLFYKLSYDDEGKNLGFYWDSEGGDPFESEGGKAWLAVPTSNGSSQLKGFALDGQTTGIQQAAVATKAEKPIFDINGRRVSTLNGAAKGVYIVGGKKVMVK